MTQDETVVEETQERVERTPEQERARRRGLAQVAIALATQSRWEDAIKVNQEILSVFPDDPEANNRIGNALSELGRIQEAIEAYERTAEAQPTNAIAQRNLQRLRRIADAGEVAARASQKLQSSFFIEEVGKTGIATLTQVAKPDVLVLVTAGDEVTLQESDGELHVNTLTGVYLGQVDQTLAERLIRLINGGNRYQAGVVMAEGSRLRILIREVYQSPEQEGRLSFPPKTSSDVRAYTRESLVRRGGDDEDDAEAEAPDVDAEDADDEDENPAEFGFSETSLPAGQES